jgi:Tic22-like family
MAIPPLATAGAITDTTKSTGLMSTKTVADMLHSVPTFTIVDAKGIPYMVVGEDAKVTGYFFTTFQEAKRLLDLARISADKALRQQQQQQKQQAKKRNNNNNNVPVNDNDDDDNMVNPWTRARIATVPLDFAVTVVTKSMSTKNYFQVAPAFQDVEDALEITGKEDLPEGKVPLFYMENFTIPATTAIIASNSKELGTSGQTTTTQCPLYFRKSELMQDYKKYNPTASDNKMPPILVTELFAVLLELVKPGGTEEELKNLVVMVPKGSLEKAKQCEKVSGKEPPFVLGQRNLVL